MTKAILIGLDAATLDLIDKYSKEGVLPNITALMEEGTTTEAFCCLPPATSVNWNTVSTGAYPGTHGVVSMAMANPRDQPDKYESGFSSKHCLAEHIWDAAEGAGKKVILLKYTTSWPPTIKNGIQVEGYADPDTSIHFISPKTVYTEQKNEVPYIFGATKAPGKKCFMSFQIKPHPANDWYNLPKSFSEPLETELILKPIEGASKTVFVLLIDRHRKGYDTIVISPRKNTEERWAELSVGQFSPWITEKFQTSKGEVEGIFRFKLYALSPDATRIRLYRSHIWPTSGWTYPYSLATELTKEIGPYYDIAGTTWVIGHWLGGPGRGNKEEMEFLIDEFGYQKDWLGKAANYLMSNHEWDFFATQLHAIDLINHAYYRFINPEDPLSRVANKMIREAYRLSDKYVGEILKQTDDETFIVVLSDHGYIEHNTQGSVNINQLLATNGLLYYKEIELGDECDESADGKRKIPIIDWSRTKAYESGNFVWINLKGRQPNGIVEPSEYEDLRNEIVRLLESANSPLNPVDKFTHIVMKKEDAEIFGLWGDRVGDIVYFAKAWYHGGHHGNFNTTRGKYGSMRAVAIFKGPGVKKGERLKRPIFLVDIAPTIAHVMNIPTPKNAEGRILHEVFK